MATLEERIAEKPAPKVTKAHLDAIIVGATYYPQGTLMLCVLEVANGFMAVGQSACASPENYDARIGRELAYHDAYNKLWALEGYLLRQRLYEGGKTNG